MPRNASKPKRKLKTHRGAAKRFKLTATGKLLRMVRVTFQSREATFTDAQVADFSAKIVTALESRLAATLRAS